jgi:hypothetical protein
MDILGTNRLGRALYPELSSNPNEPANLARFTFLDPGAACQGAKLPYIDGPPSA